MFQTEGFYKYIEDLLKEDKKTGQISEQSKVALAFLQIMTTSKESNKEALNIIDEIFQLTKNKNMAMQITIVLILLTQVTTIMGYSDVNKRIDALNGFADLATIILKNQPSLVFTPDTCAVCGRNIEVLVSEKQSVNICMHCKGH